MIEIEVETEREKEGIHIYAVLSPQAITEVHVTHTSLRRSSSVTVSKSRGGCTSSNSTSYVMLALAGISGSLTRVGGGGGD